jgi:type II secretory ATPase GspE/PulE/Tfp pilus assembly ATPase PilB-like protein
VNPVNSTAKVIDVDFEHMEVHENYIDACSKSLDTQFPFVVTTDGYLLIDNDNTSTIKKSDNLVINKAYLVAKSLALRTSDSIKELHIDRAKLINIVGRSNASSLDNSDSDSTKSNAEHIMESILAEAVLRQASDVHIRAVDDGACYYFRVHGSLTKRKLLNQDLARLAVNQLINMKVKNDPKLAAPTRPVNGTINNFKIQLKDGSAVYRELRLSKIPVLGGSKLVIRINDSNAKVMTLDGFNYPQDVMSFLEREVAKVHGLVMVTGPTGSGKTNLLAAMTASADDTRQKISVEDPVEIKLEGVDQIQVISGSKELTFEKVLPIVLRQDPDLLMFGEVRTAEVASHLVQFTRTGHLVLTTTHVNSASQAPERLMDLGIDASELRSTLSSVIGVRLVQLLCEKCKISASSIDVEISIFQRKKLTYLTKDISSLYVKSPLGCPDCNHMGIKGRQSVIEFIEIDDDDYSYIIGRRTVEWEKYLRENKGWKSMGDRARELVLQGLVDPLDIEKFVYGVFP